MLPSAPSPPYAYERIMLSNAFRFYITDVLLRICVCVYILIEMSEDVL